MKCNLIFRRFLCHFEYIFVRIEAEPKHSRKKPFSPLQAFNAFARLLGLMIELRVITLYRSHFIQHTSVYAAAVRTIIVAKYYNNISSTFQIVCIPFSHISECVVHTHHSILFLFFGHSESSSEAN